jgi:hypothetical protein
MTEFKPPIPDSYWVIPGQFLAGEYPMIIGDLDATARRIGAYFDAGIDTFIDLTEIGELVPYEYLLHEASLFGHRSITYHRHSIGDYGLPTAESMKTILDTIDAALAAGHKVYLHCWGGVGRTGTTVGCYLVRHGMTGNEALSQLAEWWRRVPKSARYLRTPETAAQAQFIRDWKG